jgi:hypothetical protein
VLRVANLAVSSCNLLTGDTKLNNEARLRKKGMPIYVDSLSDVLFGFFFPSRAFVFFTLSPISKRLFHPSSYHQTPAPCGSLYTTILSFSISTSAFPGEHHEERSLETSLQRSYSRFSSPLFQNILGVTRRGSPPKPASRLLNQPQYSQPFLEETILTLEILNSPRLQI